MQPERRELGYIKAHLDPEGAMHIVLATTARLAIKKMQHFCRKIAQPGLGLK